jgi:hypothetical protein
MVFVPDQLTLPETDGGRSLNFNTLSGFHYFDNIIYNITVVRKSWNFILST